MKSMHLRIFKTCKNNLSKKKKNQYFTVEKMLLDSYE